MGSTEEEVSWTSFYNIIDGKKVSSKEFYHGLDPSTGEKLWDVPVATKEDMENSVAAARKAFELWSNIPFEKRIEKLKEYGKALKPYFGEFTDLLMKESGKPKPFAAGETASACGLSFDFFLNQTLPEKTITLPDREVKIKLVPIGVVAAICPWNFPIGQASMKFLPALAAGNTVILKPSPFVPYSALKLVEIAQKFLPPGVLQVLGGDDKLGPFYTTHPNVDKITFTGSTATGKKVVQACAGTLKRVTLELGGNDACIVCPDIDVDAIAGELVLGAFFNTGQICTATKRLFVHKDIYPQMLKALAKATKALKVGSPEEEGVVIGPLQNKMQFDKIKDVYAEIDEKKFGVERGQEVGSKGFFLQPTIVDNPSEDTLLLSDEQMGPILPMLPWTDEAEVIKHANNSDLGLGGSVWSKDLARAQRIADALDTGSVFLNSMPKTSIEVPFSGFKQSGLGVEGGPWALEGYCNQKAYHYFTGAGGTGH